ncbi:MAG: methylated-DNA--[protein]-cysteine S-methyltransferase [Ignavibacteriales bacterium]|nr:MAG: methylated-DNA--[protein]-cysteine S-methyltransferase [Ignavibacteriales bacterium]
MKKEFKMNDDIMYEALIKKDASFDGIFFAGIKTTGIFCRPTCTARKPKKENTIFFKTSKDAILHGYRPCKVCTPLNKPGETPEWIQNILREMDDNPAAKLKDFHLRSKGVEPNKLRRWFKKNHGITFHSYQRMLRINNAFKQIQNGEKIISAALDSGYESLSGFNDSFKMILGTSPLNSKDKKVINVMRIETPLGPMFAGATDEGICLFEFTDRKMLETELKTLSRLLSASIIQGSNSQLINLKQQIDEYFKGNRKIFNLPLITPGSQFQNIVWNELQKIPYGTTRSYKTQAASVKRPEAVRAVANANGQNRIAIIIPCHRVIGEDGHLTGYGGGLWRKKWLLDFEKENLSKLN